MTVNYTKPRRPVAGMSNGPGPTYVLPSLCGYFSHDPQSTHVKCPAYSLGQRCKASDMSHSAPGPNRYLPDTQCVKPSAPKYSLCGRPKDMTNNNSPDPAAYGDVGRNTAVPRAPAYTFGGRYLSHSSGHGYDPPGPAAYHTPDTRYYHPKFPDYSLAIRFFRPPGDNIRKDAPNAYSLPTPHVESRRRRAPCHVIASRNKNGGFDHDLQNTPGPAAYSAPDTRYYRPKPPGYSLAIRYRPPGDNTRKPGPGAHSPENVQGAKRSTPKFSFGTRHSAFAVSLIVPA